MDGDGQLSAWAERRGGLQYGHMPATTYRVLATTLRNMTFEG
jgi:hypothetical protein